MKQCRITVMRVARYDDLIAATGIGPLTTPSWPGSPCGRIRKSRISPRG